MNNWFNVPTTQTPTFVLFLSAEDLFDCALSLWVSLKKHLNVRSVYYNVSFLSEKSFWNLSSLLHNLTYLSPLNSFLLLVLSTFHVFLKNFNNYFFRWLVYKSLLEEFYYDNKIYYMVFQSFFCIQLFFMSRVFQGSGFSGSGSRV